MSTRSRVAIADVRSPGEFEEGHIPGAVNLPLFSDSERAQVGTIYKQKGKEKAIELGLEIVGPKMNLLANKAKTLAVNSKLNVHCWRGGMRSEKMAWLFDLVGIDTTILIGGYKAYRQQLLDDFQNLDRLILLQGPTGSGKTKILHELENLGEQIIDLEHHARHKGSAFGALGMEEQPNTARFQNTLYEDYLKLDPSKRIWIESESITIGRVYLPQTLWDAMNRSPVIEIDLEKKLRTSNILAEYGHFDHELLASSIQKIQSRFGGDRVKKALALLEEDRLEELTWLLLEYYDKSYTFSKNKYKEKEVATFQSENADPLSNAIQLQKIADHLKL
ncbi:MAG: tRNA 2-selenouridine(34) synthase MnmH [Cyclobacteriaceae bacterium]|nr:tRNA 2-selenouridine(34) synthase MnmH [Cyclobacteriaceae bacterium]